MAENREIGIDLFIDSRKASNSLGELKRSIKELKNEALNFEQGSAEFNKLTAAAGQLNDRIADINGTVKVLSGNVTENLTRSFSSVAQAGVGGFQAIIGAQALFGSQNEDLQKQLVKLQGVMNFAAGLREFANIGQAAKDFKTVILSLIPTVVTKTAVTEADTAVQQQNTFSLIASGVASAALAVKNGILSASTVVVTGLTEAFGITATAAWAAATLGVSLLITGIVALVAYWDEINAKVKEFGIAGEIAFGLLLGPLYLAYKGIEALGEALGIFDSDVEESAERRAEAEAKYKDSIEASNKSIGESRRRVLLATGKISEEEAARQKAKEDFITAYLKAQEDARTKIKEAKSVEEKAVIKKDLDARLKALQEEYKADIVEINKGEKDKNDAKAKADADARKQAADRNKAAREKEAADNLKDTEAFNQKLLQTQNVFATEEEKINQETKRKIAEFDKAFADLTAQERLARQSEYLEGLLNLELEGQQKINKIKEDEEEKKKAKEKEEQDKLKAAQETFLSTLTSNADARLSAEEAILNEGNNRKLELERQFEALSAEEKVLRKQQLDDEIKAINADTNKQLEDQQKESAEKQAQIEKDLNDKKVQGIKNSLTVISNIASLFAGKSKREQEKAFRIQKGVAIAQATIDTFQSANAAYNSLVGTPIVGPALATIAAAAAITAGLANVKKIKEQKFEGGGPEPGPGPAPGPDTNLAGAQVGSTNEGPGGISALPTFDLRSQQIGGAGSFLGLSNQGQNGQPVRVFVTETDISNVQGKVQVIQGNALFGGGGG